MAEPLPYPKHTVWETDPWNDGDRPYFSGNPVGDAAAFEMEEHRAYQTGFSVALGSFELSGDAQGYDEAKRCAELAFRALIDLNNVLDQAPREPPLAALSERERAIVDKLRAGRRPMQIAKELFISHHTVRNYLKKINLKLGVHSQVELLSLVGGNRG